MTEMISSTNSDCIHCGAPLGKGQINYCCLGCENIAQLLKEIPSEAQNTQSELIAARMFSKREKGDSKYLFLDQEDFRTVYKHDENATEFHFYIEGVHCASCVKLLESLPRLHSGVEWSELHYGDNILILKTQNSAKLSEIADLVERMGYRPFPMAKDYDLGDFFAKENRADLIRIGIGVAATMNIMLLAVSIYSGLHGDLAKWFGWVQFVLFLPIATYCAVPYYKGALRSVRYGQISIDLPISIALLLSGLFSLKSLIDGNDQIYFDSTASFITLILASRYLLKRLQQKSQEFSLFSEFIQKPGAWIKEAVTQKLIYKPIANIQVNEVVVIPKGERIPVDGILQTNRASLDFSVITGESMPKTLTKGMAVLAGSKSYTDNIEILATRTGTKTQLGEMLKGFEASLKRKTPGLNKADKASQILIVLVLFIAAVFYFIYTSTHNQAHANTEAFGRALALIVVACPCALALGAPLALSQGIRRAFRMGIIIKSPETLEKAILTRQIAFDKTGTLTIGALSLREAPLMSAELKAIVLGLESQSEHPIAFAIREVWTQIKPAKVDHLTEIPGVGVHGEIENNFYEFKKSTEASTYSRHIGPKATLYKNGAKVLTLEFADQIKPESLELIQRLNKLGITCAILSGDNETTVRAVASKLNIEQIHAKAEMAPEEKKNWLLAHPGTVMVGDGANDLLGMGESHFSVAVKGSVHEALKLADVYISKENLLHLVTLFEIAKETQKVIRNNIVFALGYNSLAGGAALLGLIGPLGSAVLMPISSLLIVGSSFYGTFRLRQLENLANHQRNNENCALPQFKKKDGFA
jgi:Cu2+-exporting ATPase/Cu+-exporting ATPase